VVVLQYKVYVVPELGGNATEVLWCGLPSLNDSTVCHLKLSSRQPSYVTIKGEQLAHLQQLYPSAAARSCCPCMTACEQQRSVPG
jgi:hypothetical protein